MAKEKILKSKVYLIGAGPGDPGLISVKGLKYLKQADVVVYDNLVSDKLLNDAKAGAKIIYAGKKAGKHFFTQDKINRVLVKEAKKNKIVARLKGGDPFTFGRGGEEALELSKEKIPFEIIPGVSSGIAVPAYAGIPVTHRDFNSTLTFVTGHEADKKNGSGIDWPKISRGIETLVFFMGTKNLKRIAEKLMANGADKNTPIALISSGTLSKQRTIIGTLKNIHLIAEREKIKPPSVIVVGKVVNLRDKLKWFEKKALFGKTILTTRSRVQSEGFSALLEEQGAGVVELPAIRFAYPDDLRAIDKAINNLKNFDWMIFTSAIGAKYFFDRVIVLKKDIRKIGNLKIAAIGPATASGIEKYFLKVDFQPTEFVAETFFKEFRAKYGLKGKNILLARSDKARDYLVDQLAKSGCRVESLVAYETLSEKNYSGQALQKIKKGEIDLAVFTSSSTVDNFFRVYKSKGRPNFKIASIGPITSAALAKKGFAPDIEAREYTINGIMKAILKYYEADPRYSGGIRATAL